MLAGEGDNRVKESHVGFSQGAVVATLPNVRFLVTWVIREKDKFPTY